MQPIHFSSSRHVSPKLHRIVISSAGQQQRVSGVPTYTVHVKVMCLFFVDRHPKGRLPRARWVQQGCIAINRLDLLKDPEPIITRACK